MQEPAVHSPSRTRDCLIGGILWGLIAVMIVVALGDAVVKLGGTQRLGSLANYWLGRDAIVHRSAARGMLAAGDPVFYRRGDGNWIQVGYVESVTLAIKPAGSAGITGSPSDEALVRLRWHDSRIDPRACRLIAYQNRGTLAEMIQVMFPAEKRASIQQLIAGAMRQHGDALTDRFLPLVEKSMRESLPVVEREFLASLDRHHNQLSRLGQRWREDLIRERLLPLAKEQLLPIAQQHAEPTLREIGRELWNRASLWSFTWRAAYDKTPLPRRDLMREEWERFIRDEAIPVIESHSEELAVAVQRTLADVMRSDAVRKELAAAASLLASDPETRELIGSVLRETLVENEAVRRVWIEIWTSDEAVSAYDFASDLLGPLVHQIGEEMLGSPQRGIDPGLARLLRHQVLGKDRRWIVAMQSSDPGVEDGLVIRRGSGDPLYPMLHLAAESLDE